MSNMILKRISAAVMAVFVIVMSFSACNFSNSKAAEPSDYYIDLKTDGELVYNSKGEFSINITSDTPIFSDNISESDAEICYGSVNQNAFTDIDSVNGIRLTEDEYSLVNIKPSKLVKNSDKSVTVSFTDSAFEKNRPDSYFFIMSREGCKENKYMYAFASVKYPSFSLVSDTTQVNPADGPIRLKLTLDKSSFSADINKEDIILSGGFSDAEIVASERIGDNTLALTISCKNAVNSEYGYISVDKSAISDSAYNATVAIKIISPQVIFNTDNFEASDNFSRLTISLKDCSFTDNVSSEMFRCSSDSIEINRFDRISTTEGVLYLSFDKESADAAVSDISTCVFTVNDAALNINAPLKFSAVPEQPKVNGKIANVKEEGSEFIVTAEFSVVNGSFNVISKNSFVFGGDYSKAVVKTLTSTDETAEVVFYIPKTSSVDEAELYGTVALKSGSVVSRWGTLKAVAAFPLYYSTKESALSITDSVYDLSECTDLLAVLSSYATSSVPSDFSSIGALSAAKTDKSETFDKLYSSVLQSDKYFSLLSQKIEDMLNSEKLAVADPEVVRSKLLLKSYLTDVNMLHAAVLTAIDDIEQLIEIEGQIAKSGDTEELEKLYQEQKKHSENIISVYSGKINGMSFFDLLTRVTDIYMDAEGALYSFDLLIDKICNWEPQTYKDKSEFRCYITSLCTESAVIAFYSMGADAEIQPGDSKYVSLVHRLNELSDFSQKNTVDKSQGDGIYCNTLGRTVKLSVSSDNVLAVGELTSAEISQLENMLQKDTTLRDELLEVGFDISAVRYIICSETAPTSSVSSSSSVDKNTVRKTYSFVGKATVYDLFNSNTVTDFEYKNSVRAFEMTDREAQPEYTMVIYKNIKLYSLG